MNKLFLLVLIISMLFGTSCKTAEISGTQESRDIVKMMTENPRLAKRTYNEKVIVVQGHISQSYKNGRGQIVLSLGYKRDAEALTCTLKKNQQFTQPLKQNQAIELKGYSIFVNGKVELINCIILHMD